MRRKTAARTDILIVGGGHAGLSLAACLGAAGLDVVCLERGDGKIRQDGRTLALSSRSMKILQAAGVDALIRKNACPILDIRVADQGSPLYLDFHSEEVGKEPFGWIVENDLFGEALLKRIRQLKNVKLVTGAAIASLSCNSECARATLEDGRIFEAMLIAGADGRRSVCRESAGIEVYGWDYGQTALVCTIAHEKPHHHVAVEHFLPGGPFATLPMTDMPQSRLRPRQRAQSSRGHRPSGHRSSIVWTEKTAAADALMKMGEKEFVDLLQEKVESYLGKIELIGSRFSHPLNLQHAKHYVAERMVLIGDAAHGIHPIAGQGFNLGMGDIGALTEELLRASRLGLDLGHPGLLKRYEKRRKFDNGNMVLATDLLDRLFSNAMPPVQAVRRLGLGMVQQMPALRRFFMRTAMGV